MKHTILAALAFGVSISLAHAAVIVVGDGSTAAIFDASTGGDTNPGITSTFTADASDYSSANTSYWNDTEYDYNYNTPTAKVATWTFGNMAIGSQWEVYTTWVTNPNRSESAPYTIQGGAVINVNQELSPTADLTILDGTLTAIAFQNIGTATVNGSNQIVVTLSSAAVDEADFAYVVADAIALRAVPEPSSAALLSLGGLALILRRRR